MSQILYLIKEERRIMHTVQLYRWSSRISKAIEVRIEETSGETLTGKGSRRVFLDTASSLYLVDGYTRYMHVIIHWALYLRFMHLT